MRPNKILKSFLVLFFKKELLSLGLAATAAPMTLQQYLALTGPAPTAHIAYGQAASQYVEFYEPSGVGPFPVAVLVHGGCWSSDLGGIAQFRGMASTLQTRGIAAWSIEYRRIDEPGGGYPGTYRDIIAALDMLAADAAKYHLDTSRIVAVGHSAGGHLAQWIGARGRIPRSSRLYEAHPLAVHEIVGLGSIADLRGGAAWIRQVCDVDTAQLTGSPAPGRGDVFADTSPAAMLPSGTHTVLINGAADRQVPASVAAAYAALVRLAGDKVETSVVPGASHFDEVAVGSPAWPTVMSAIHDALAVGR
jgi:acetyl esterase/lipase